MAEEGYVEADQEFRPTLTKFKQAGAELIYIPGYYDKVAKIISQAREIGIDVPFLGADGWDSPVLTEVAGPEALNNTFFTNHYSPQDPDEKVQSFVKAYQEKYGSVPASFSATAYDAAYLLADAISEPVLLILRLLPRLWLKLRILRALQVSSLLTKSIIR